MRPTREPCPGNDRGPRCGNLTKFSGSGEHDRGSLHGTTGQPAPPVPLLPGAIDDRQFQYNTTRLHFVLLKSDDKGDGPASFDRNPGVSLLRTFNQSIRGQNHLMSCHYQS